MTAPEDSSQVVVAFDFSPMAEEALRRAIEAACRTPEYELHVITVVNPREGIAIAPTSHVGSDYVERIQRTVARRIADMLDGRTGANSVRLSIHVRIGQPVHEILALARELGASLVFVGSHGKSDLERLVLGSVSACVLREARCPVMIARKSMSAAASGT